MSRAIHNEPSVSAGCGYRASVSNGKVTIYPTVNNSDCSKVKIGLGDATFTFDPKNPPDTIKRVIGSDSKEKHAYQITPVPKRCVKLFRSVETVDESFTDADGKTTEVTMPKLNGFKIDGYTNGEYQATGIKNVASHGGRTLNSQGISLFTGAVPHNILINAVQLFTYHYGYAYLDLEGYVNIVQNGASINTRFNMGKNVSDPDITEFTVKSDNNTFICRNIYNHAVEVYAPYSSGNYFTHRTITNGVIRVASGQMLKQAKVGVIEKAILTDDGKAVAIGENDVVDIMPNGNGGIIEIKLDNGVSKIVRSVGAYSINRDKELLYDGNVIANNIISLGLFSQSHPQGLMLGKAGTETELAKKEALSVFSKAGVQDSWKDAYTSWYDNQSLPNCGWAGSGENSNTTSNSLCFKQSVCMNVGTGVSILVTDTNGEYYKVSGSTLEKQVLQNTDGNGFNAVYTVNQGGKFIAFNSSKKNFSTPETSHDTDDYLFRF